MPNATRPLPGPLSAPWPVPCSGYQHLQRAHDLVAKPRSRKRAVCVACHTGLLLIAQCTRKRPRILNLTTLAVFERFFPIFRSSSIFHRGIFREIRGAMKYIDYWDDERMKLKSEVGAKVITRLLEVKKYLIHCYLFDVAMSEIVSFYGK